MTRVAIASLTLACVVSFSAGAAVQPAKAEPQLSTESNPSAQAKADMFARFAEQRRQWRASGHKFAPGPTAGTCQITAGKLVTTRLDVAKEPAAPVVSVTYKNCTPGFLSVDAYFYSATSPRQYLQTTYNAGTFDAPTAKAGTVTFKQVGGRYGNSALNPYSAAGHWTLTDIYIADRTGSYSHYAQAALTPLFDTLTLRVTNSGTPDAAAPLITSGEVLTPKVSISSQPYFFTKLHLSDDVSGLAYLYVWVQGPGGSPSVINYTYLPLPLKGAAVQTYDYLGNQTATGTWTIFAVNVCDIAHTCTNLTNAADIQALFGTTTFKLAP
jgi:hypothetical protein